jgi:predicted AAA+ superfamily ATPase
VGKSTLLAQVLPDAPRFDLERSSHFDRISSDPEFFLSESPVPVILDEAQRCPGLFEAQRVAIDQRHDRPGQYLLSGSSSPELMHRLTETLAGRVPRRRELGRWPIHVV